MPKGLQHIMVRIHMFRLNCNAFTLDRIVLMHILRQSYQMLFLVYDMKKGVLST